MPKIEEEGKSWFRKPKLYKRVVQPYKKSFLDIFKKNSNNKFNENSSSGSKVVSFG